MNCPSSSSLTSNIIEYDLILKTFSLSDISFIRSVLDYEEINYYFIGEKLLEITTVLEPAALIVKREDVKKVLEILKGINLSYVSTL